MDKASKWAVAEWVAWACYAVAMLPLAMGLSRDGMGSASFAGFLIAASLGLANVMYRDRVFRPSGVEGTGGKRPPGFLAALIALGWVSLAGTALVVGLPWALLLASAASAATYGTVAWWHAAGRKRKGGDAS